jgi:hypothetical protein
LRIAYPVSGVPPVELGVSQEIFIPEDVSTLAVFLGAVDRAMGIKEADGEDGTDDPSEFVAVTVNV